ncbi:MAG: hypothetical protein EPO13_06170 [Actinomycetota bacterium]|nr:MAG: hypothetical protein EPO13_06170 [Actinomycetota bacterium]
MTQTLAPTTSTLSALDRCDRCGAQAYVRVALTAGGELLFCSHHYAEHGAALKDKAASILDETHRLTDVVKTVED